MITMFQCIAMTLLFLMTPIAGESHLQGPDAAVPSRSYLSLSGFNLKAESATYQTLPKRLREVSGLAMTRDNRLLAHNDEKGIIFEVDYQAGTIVKAWALTDKDKPVSDDFEGMAVANDDIYLVTSSGRLYRCREGADGTTVLFTMYTTGTGRACEIEGLAYDPDERLLLLMCKNARRTELKDHLAIYRWSIDTKTLVEGHRTLIPLSDFSRYTGSPTFQPSGLERHPVSGNYFVVAARQHAIAEITPSGQVVAVKVLSAKQHPQAEGITFTRDGALIISDEGKGKAKEARLTLYRSTAR